MGAQPGVGEASVGRAEHVNAHVPCGRAYAGGCGLRGVPQVPGAGCVGLGAWPVSVAAGGGRGAAPSPLLPSCSGSSRSSLCRWLWNRPGVGQCILRPCRPRLAHFQVGGPRCPGTRELHVLHGSCWRAVQEVLHSQFGFG